MERSLGAEIRAVYRVLYRFEGEVDENDGPIAFHLGDDRWLFLEDTAGGELLRASQRRPTVSSDKADTGDGWRLVDVSEKKDYVHLVGQVLSSYREIASTDTGSTVGLRLTMGEATVDVIASCDEVRVCTDGGEHVFEELRLEWRDFPPS